MSGLSRKTLNDYLSLTKPRLTAMAALSALLGTLLAGGDISVIPLLEIFIGAFLVGGACNAYNQILETDVDALMRRTENRPMPRGRIGRAPAMLLATALALCGTTYLWSQVNLASAGVGVVTLLTYILLYTPLKRITPLNTFVGAVPGALPPVLGWAASGRTLWSVEALILFMILYLWQLPHFLCIAWIHREDYTRGGLRMMPESDPSGMRTAKQILFFTLILFPVSLLPCAIGLAGWPYLIGMLAANGLFVALALALLVRRFDNPRRFVLTSIVYLVLLMASAAIDRACL